MNRKVFIAINAVLLAIGQVDAFSWSDLTTAPLSLIKNTYTFIRPTTPLISGYATYHLCNRFKVPQNPSKATALIVGLLHSGYLFATRTMHTRVLLLARDKNNEWNALLSNHEQSRNKFSEFLSPATPGNFEYEVKDGLDKETCNKFTPLKTTVRHKETGVLSAYAILTADSFINDTAIADTQTNKTFHWIPVKKLMHRTINRRAHRFTFGINNARPGELSPSFIKRMEIYKNSIITAIRATDPYAKLSEKARTAPAPTV